MTIYPDDEMLIISRFTFSPSHDPRYGFVSYCSHTTQDCVAGWVVADALSLANTDRADELIRDPSGEFAEASESARLVDIDVLRDLELRLDCCDVLCYLSTQEGRDLALLAVALLNYDARHIADDTPVFYQHEERQKVLRLITVVADELVEPELIGRVLQINPLMLRAKDERNREQIMKQFAAAKMNPASS